MRLGKYLAQAGIASRRGSEEIIREGRVMLGGKVCTDPARDVDGSKRVSVDGSEITPASTKLVYAANKPIGVVSTSDDPAGRPTVVELVASPERLFPVGRLDIQTSGLILLTNDGELANLLTHPRYEVSKTYRARLGGGALGATALRALSGGVELADGPTLPARVHKIAAGLIEIEVREGRNHQVRRMCEAVGHPVNALERVAIGPLRIGRLHEGGHRRLSAKEVDALRDAANRG